ncbi:hypothetical protein DFQ30_001092, partial [Apophysomyces sp. BC1015]
MARITVEDCLELIPNRFELALAATYRARQLAQGHTPKIESKDKPTVLALPWEAHMSSNSSHASTMSCASRGADYSASRRTQAGAKRPASAGAATADAAGVATETSPARAYIDAVLEQSFRHLFGPTATPEQPRKHEVVSIAKLTEALSIYMMPAEIKEIKAAFHFSDQAHLGQYRQSGEPYITHPVAVAEICASWKLDAQSIMAALLHDVMEDQGITKTELAERFGTKVADLVDGLSKLDKMEFRSREEAQAENFRKMLLAMARD